MLIENTNEENKGKDLAEMWCVVLDGRVIKTFKDKAKADKLAESLQGDYQVSALLMEQI